jgi:hypothetical protein
VSALQTQIEALDSKLFDYVEAQTSRWDRQALLALHAAAAAIFDSFVYLEIGSYLGGSLQVLMRDPRCRQVISIDARLAEPADARPEGLVYEDNSTAHMLELLHELPDVDMDKLMTIDGSTDRIRPSDLGTAPDYCFIDGEHTHSAVLRDAHFCAEAMGGTGVIAFHDYPIVGSAIGTFLRENWREITYAVAFNGPLHPAFASGVFALELGGTRMLGHPSIKRAIGSRWHAAVWNLANRPRRTALPFLAAWTLMPAIDSFIVHARHGAAEYLQRGRSSIRALGEEPHARDAHLLSDRFREQ